MIIYYCFIVIIIVHELWMYPTSEGYSLLNNNNNNNNNNINYNAIWSCMGDIFAIAVLLVLKISLSISAYEKV